MEQKWLYAVIGLVIGAVLTFVINPNNLNKEEQTTTQTITHDVHNMQSTMNNMTGSLSGKSGEEFDKAFLSEMIIHHQGAIDMANLAKMNAFHQEIKDLSDEIISAQTKEIEMMKQWQKDWGY